MELEMFNQKAKFYPIVIIILSLMLAYSCKIMDGGFNMYPVSEDISLGNDIQQKIESDTANYPMYKEPVIQEYLQSMVNEILKSPLIKHKKDFSYKVYVIDKDVINAFCTPGGYIYVYTGLMKFLDNEATLAAVLAHEIAHAELRHATQRMTSSYGVDILNQAIKNQTDNEYADVASNLFSGMSLLQNSRDNEYEADEFSFKYLQSTQWFPGAALHFFQKVIALVEAGNGNSLDRLMSTHPLSMDRIEKLTELMKAAKLPPPNEKNLFYRKYAKIKKEYL